MNLPEIPWSKLPRTHMGEFVIEYMGADPRRYYHNFEHVSRLYQLAAEWDVPYDVELDTAILWHDVVYDEQPHKEHRSCVLMRECAKKYPTWFAGIGLEKVNDLIMNTTDHRVRPDVSSILIQLDLADFTDPVRRQSNFWKIMQESTELYRVNRYEFAKANKSFLIELNYTMQYNIQYDKLYRDFWISVSRGIHETINTAAMIIDQCDRVNKHG